MVRLQDPAKWPWLGNAGWVEGVGMVVITASQDPVLRRPRRPKPSHLGEPLASVRPVPLPETESEGVPV